MKQINVPLLAINGDRDFITLSKLIFPVVEQVINNTENNNFTILELPNLNHWFQTCKTGSINEYGASEETISPLALNTMSEWILERVIN